VSRAILLSDPYSIAPEDALEFRLVYNGLLLGAAKNNPRSEHKHELRQAFNIQLKTLWERSSNLRNWDSWERPKNRLMRERLAEHFQFNGVGYVPLSWDELGVACTLDILMLRPEMPGQTLIKGGDINNRLKTLFDALRIPQAGETSEPATDEPFYCLLQDDRLINNVSVTTDHLLAPVNQNYVQLIITVKLWSVTHNNLNMGIY
jgi:hypothetical protein